MVIKDMKKAALILSLIFANNVFACSCSEFPTLSERYGESEIVVLAKLSAAGTNQFGHATFKWDITELIKGAKPDSLENVEQGLTSCDPQLKEEQEWLLFLEEGESPVLGWCSFNQNAEYLEEGWRDALVENH